MRIVGIIILIAGMLIGIGSNIDAFIDIPSLIICVTFTLGVMWISGASLPGMIGALFATDLSEEARAEATSAWRLATHAVVASGVVGVLIGAVIMLRNLDDIGSIGPGAAICIMTALYGITIGYGFFMPCRRYVEMRAGS